MIFSAWIRQKPEECLLALRRAWYKCFTLLVTPQLVKEYNRRITNYGRSHWNVQVWLQEWDDHEKLRSLPSIPQQELAEYIERYGMIGYSKDTGNLVPTIRFKRSHRTDYVCFVTDESPILDDKFTIENIENGIKVLSSEQFVNHLRDDENYLEDAIPLLHDSY